MTSKTNVINFIWKIYLSGFYANMHATLLYHGGPYWDNMEPSGDICRLNEFCKYVFETDVFKGIKYIFVSDTTLIQLQTDVLLIYIRYYPLKPSLRSRHLR